MPPSYEAVQQHCFVVPASHTFTRRKKELYGILFYWAGMDGRLGELHFQLTTFSTYDGLGRLYLYDKWSVICSRNAYCISSTDMTENLIWLKETRSRKLRIICSQNFVWVWICVCVCVGGASRGRKKEIAKKKKEGDDRREKLIISCKFPQRSGSRQASPLVDLLMLKGSAFSWSQLCWGSSDWFLARLSEAVALSSRSLSSSPESYSPSGGGKYLGGDS